MYVGMDIQSTVGVKTGIGYYVLNLIEQLKKIDKVRLSYYKNDSLQNLNTLKRIYWENISLPNLFSKDNPSIVHIPGFAGPRFRTRIKRVTTVHDLIGILYPENLSPISRFYWQKWLPDSIQTSDMIIAISDNTKRDIMRLLGVADEKIQVVLSAAGENFKPITNEKQLDEVRKKYNLPQEFILNVGTIEPRKNILGLLEAFSAYLKESKSSESLVLVGKKDWGYQDVLKRVDELGITPQVIFTDYVSDEDLPVLYTLCKVFIYPSFYEGFGLPVLEALACGKPVICSKTSSLPEIAGGAAILIDPENVRELKDAIYKMANDVSIREEFSEKALIQAGKFSWKKTASQTLEVYKQMLT